MSRPANVRNPFDWKRSMIRDLDDVGALTARQTEDLLRIVDADEESDRDQGQQELAALHQRLSERPWWKRILS